MIYTFCCAEKQSRPRQCSEKNQLVNQHCKPSLCKTLAVHTFGPYAVFSISLSLVEDQEQLRPVTSSSYTALYALQEDRCSSMPKLSSTMPINKTYWQEVAYVLRLCSWRTAYLSLMKGISAAGSPLWKADDKTMKRNFINIRRIKNIFFFEEC